MPVRFNVGSDNNATTVHLMPPAARRNSVQIQPRVDEEETATVNDYADEVGGLNVQKIFK